MSPPSQCRASPTPRRRAGRRDLRPLRRCGRHARSRRPPRWPHRARQPSMPNSCTQCRPTEQRYPGPRCSPCPASASCAHRRSRNTWVGLPVLRRSTGKLRPVKPRAAARALLVCYHVLKGAEVPAAVVEHAVDYNADAPGVQGVHHGAERLVPAEAGVDVHVVYGVVLVIFAGGEDGV